jgi:hypothetical protein
MRFLCKTSHKDSCAWPCLTWHCQPIKSSEYNQRETTIVSDWKHYLQQYTKIIKTPTLQTYFSYIFIKIEAYTKPNDVWSLRFKLEVFIWRHVVNVPKTSTRCRGILICVISRSGICKNTFLCSVLHWRIIMIKRFFSGFHACVHGVDALSLSTWWSSFGAEM